MNNLSAKVNQRRNAMCSNHLKAHDYETWAKFNKEASDHYGYIRKYESIADVTRSVYTGRPVTSVTVTPVVEEAPNYPVWENEIAAAELKNCKN
jgi:hypothetical protein